jgi:ribonucleoside-diphosphate reductase alpha chain
MTRAAAESRLTPNALRVLESRYLRRDGRGVVVETPRDLFRRVAGGVAGAEERFGGAGARSRWEEAFFESLASLDFLPNSPTLMNAGTPLGQLSACFVLPVEDSMADIFESLKLMALVQQSGGGTGFSFSRLRPRGDVVASTGGAASGPVSFMRIFDCATENIRQGGKRRGANMGVLRVDHPDIHEFVDSKLDDRSFRNFNISVAVTDAFMEAAARDLPFDLRHPSSGKTVRSVKAGELMARIARAAWRTGDPGLIFLDAIERANPTPRLGAIESTNPCGEIPLLPHEACNLAAVNLSRMVRDGTNGKEVDREKLRRTVRLAVRFLDDVVEVSRWPAPEIAAMVSRNRKIGLGVMGFAEMLILLGIPYAGSRAVALAESIMELISGQAAVASGELAEERGVFPEWEGSIHARAGRKLRNATLTSIAPTGTVSIIAGTSAGIEPLFALAYSREHVLGEETLPEVNPLFLRHAEARGFYSEDLLRELRWRGVLAGIPGVPPEDRDLFRTALEIAPEDHLRIQVAFQKHVDNAVSKTINMPEASTEEDVAAIYRRAWELGLKGITVYRYGSKGQQVLNLGVEKGPEEYEHFARCDRHTCEF